MFEGVYYGPLLFLSISTLVCCCISSYLTVGFTALIATVCYLLVLLLMVMHLFTSPLMGAPPQNSQGSIIRGTLREKLADSSLHRG